MPRPAPTSIADGTETFCFYCQQEFYQPEYLDNHLLHDHKDTYAYWAVKERQEREREGA